MKYLFCILGMTGSGKTTALNYLLDPNNNKYGLDLGNLIYHTTRKKRENEVDGVDYRFADFESMSRDNYNNNLIEYRSYKKIDEEVFYYTTYSDIHYAKNNIVLCAASVNQAISYQNKLDNVYTIVLEVPIKVRLNRLIDRATNDTEIKEACRRILEEENEFKNIMNLDDNKMFHINNTIELEDAMSEVYRFINNTVNPHNSNA